MQDDRQSITQAAAYPVYYPQDEISLSEIFAVLKRRYRMIVLIVVLAAIAAGFYVATAQSIYESRAVLRIGVIGGMENVSRDKPISGDKPIEEPTILVKRLIEDYGIEDAQNRPKLPRLESVSVDKGSNELIEIVAQAYSPDEAQVFLSNVVETLLAEHEKLYANARQLLGGQLEYLQGVKVTVDQALTDIDAQVKGLTQQDTSAAALFALEKSRLVEQSLEVEGRISELKITQELKSHPSSLLRSATYSDGAVAPKRGLILTLATILALFAAIVFAFIIEFLKPNDSDKDSESKPAKD